MLIIAAKNLPPLSLGYWLIVLLIDNYKVFKPNNFNHLLEFLIFRKI